MNRLFLASLLLVGGCTPRQPISAAPTIEAPAPSGRAVAAQTPALAVAQSKVKTLDWSILRAFPHDPTSFTEGLLWHDDSLYESTGLEGQSKLRRVDLQSGQAIKSVNLPKEYFGEGLALMGNRLYQLTWQTKIGFVYDAQTFKPLAKFNYRNEGWGLAFDGTDLIQSDGSDVLTFRDTKNFAAKKTLQVTRDGAPLRNLNELEWIDGYLWANVWQTDDIVIINPQNGEVVAQLDLTGLLGAADRTGAEDVLNGIAYDAANKRVFVTGKNWSKLFWIRVENTPMK